MMTDLQVWQWCADRCQAAIDFPTFYMEGRSDLVLWERGVFTEGEFGAGLIKLHGCSQKSAGTSTSHPQTMPSLQP